MLNIKVSFIFFLFYLMVLNVRAQDQKIADSLAIVYAQNDLPVAEKLEQLKDLSFNEVRDIKKGLVYADELISLAEQTGDNKYLRIGYFLKGTKKLMLGEYDNALEAYFKSAEIAKKSQHLAAEGESYIAVADTYSMIENHSNAKNYYRKAIQILRTTDSVVSLASALLNAGEELRLTSNFDSSLLYFAEAKQLFDSMKYRSGMAYSRGNMGMVYASMGKSDLAEKNIKDAIRILEEKKDYYPICDFLISMSGIYAGKGDKRSALNYALKSLQLAEQYGLKKQVADASLKLSELYQESGDLNEALNYYKKNVEYRDSFYNVEKVQNMADLRTNYEVSQKQAEVNVLNQKRRNQNNLLILFGIIIGLTIMILGILLRNNQNKQKAYKVLDLQKKETDAQKAKAEDALAELQLTQKLLIQSAKMASLGELTAGIAHEIQNPLNFVNNFAEVSVEMLDELREGTANKLSGNGKTEANDIINDLAENLKKINEHGKRADAIVKGMLLHSRTSTGKKELININTLAGEYIRLSYHGIRVKDKGFNANFECHFDESIEKIAVIPQDIGRVLLNLYNNAFYAVNNKKKQAGDEYDPLVVVTTKKVGHNIELSVKDNGLGIPQVISDKVFQPFFTTKPSGQGTGLGLSLSYDIIVAHGGELKMKTKEGEFAEFIIQLPLDNNHVKAI